MTAPTSFSSPPPLNAALVALTAEAATELAPVWQLNPANIAGALKDVLPALVHRWGLASASTAADWYDQLRESQGISGRFTAIVPSLDHLGAEALAGWGAQPLRDAKSIVAPTKLPVTNLDVPAAKPGLRITTTDLVPQEPGPRITTVEAPATLDPIASAQYRVEGGLQKRLVNAANLTVTHSAAEDPQARGWMRKTRPNACGFCLLVASRGGVYTKASSTFACHEHCFCTAVPAWGGQELPVQPYKPSPRQSTAADRARVRQWIKDNL